MFIVQNTIHKIRDLVDVKLILSRMLVPLSEICNEKQMDSLTLTVPTACSFKKKEEIWVPAENVL